MSKYFEMFEDREQMWKEFSDHYYSKPVPPIPDDFPTDDEILYACYAPGCYSGEAFVLYKKDGKLYEVNASHCSCYGLEGCWNPEETSWEALEMRKTVLYDWDKESEAAFKELLASRLEKGL